MVYKFMVRAVEDMVEYLGLDLDEKRVINILFDNSFDVNDISKKYKQMYDVNIGNKIYHILNNLVKKGFVLKTKKIYSCNQEKITSEVEKSINNQMKDLVDDLKKINNIKKPSLTVHASEKQVAELFAQIDKMELQGSEEHGIIDILSYPIKLSGSKKQHAQNKLKQVKKVMNIRRKKGALEYHIAEKSKLEKYYKYQAKEYGKDYIIGISKLILNSLEHDNFNIVFSDNVVFKFFVVPDKCAVTAWFSSPNKKYLDRAIVFWNKDDIKGLDEYFWSEWKRALNGRSEKQIKEEAKEFYKKILKELSK